MHTPENQKQYAEWKMKINIDKTEAVYFVKIEVNGKYTDSIEGSKIL